jgi:hypothetical protein
LCYDTHHKLEMIGYVYAVVSQCSETDDVCTHQEVVNYICTVTVVLTVCMLLNVAIERLALQFPTGYSENTCTKLKCMTL